MIWIRKERRAALAAIGLALALMAIVAVGWVVLVSNDYVKVEAGVQDIDFGKNPWTAKVHVRITNLYTGALVVERFSMTVWADKAETAALTSAEAGGVVIEPGATKDIVIPVEIRNQDAFSGVVWVDADATWAHGEEHYSEHVEDREISVGAALASLS